MIDDNSFLFCKKLEQIDIPNTVTSIGDSAFWGCDNLVSVNLGNNVTILELYSFASCKNLSTITLPASIETNKGGTFNSCFNLTSIYCKADNPPYLGPYMYFSGVVKFFVPAEKVDEYRSAEGWEEYAYAIVGYNFQTGEVVPEYPAADEIWYTSSTGDIVEPYDKSAFNASVMSNTYSNGRGVIKFSGTVTEIGQFAFRECGDMTSVVIPKSVTKIGSSAFYSSGLVFAEIGSGVTGMENYAFGSCANLKVVHCKPLTPPTIGYYVFDDCSSELEICVPTESYSTYRNAYRWNTYYSTDIVACDFAY